MLKCIIFDLDGTIGNTLPLCITALRQTLEPLTGRTFSDQDIRDTFGPSEEGIIQNLVPDRSAEGIEQFLTHYQNLHPMCNTPFEGMAELLHDLSSQKIPLALVTGKGASGTKITLSRFGLQHTFDYIETGSPQGSRKVEAIRHVLNQFGCAPEESLYIGDSPSDIVECREVGVPIVSAAWAGTANIEQLRALKPDWLFTSIADFSTFIKDALVTYGHTP